MSSTPLKERWKYRIDASGRALAVNIDTGEVAYRELTHEELQAGYDRVVVDGEGWWVPREIEAASPLPSVRYNALVGDLLCQHVVEGASITEACRRVGITYSQLCKWRRDDSGLAERLRQAKRDRAELWFEKVVEIAETTGEGKGELELGRLRADIYKHVSAVTNEEFSPQNRQKIDARIGAVSVETGIRRPGDDGFVEPLDFAVIEEAQKKVGE